jgi:hypothetical protein
VGQRDARAHHREAIRELRRGLAQLRDRLVDAALAQRDPTQPHQRVGAAGLERGAARVLGQHALGVEGAARGVGERAGEVQRVEIVGVELAGLAREAIALAHHLDARAIGGAVGIVELAQHRLELHHQLGDALRVRVQRLAPEVGRRRRGRRRRGDAIRPGDAEGRSDERGGEEPGGGPHAIEYDPRAAGRPGLAAGDWSHRWRGATA